MGPPSTLSHLECSLQSPREAVLLTCPQGQGDTRADTPSDRLVKGRDLLHQKSTFPPGTRVFATFPAGGQALATFCSDLEKGQMKDSIPRGRKPQVEPKKALGRPRTRTLERTPQTWLQAGNWAVHPSGLAGQLEGPPAASPFPPVHAHKVSSMKSLGGPIPRGFPWAPVGNQRVSVSSKMTPPPPPLRDSHPPGSRIWSPTRESLALWFSAQEVSADPLSPFRR